MSSVVSLITSLCKASDDQKEVEVEGGVITCICLYISGLDDGTTGKLRGIWYGICDNLCRIKVELGTFSLHLLTNLGVLLCFVNF